MTCLLVLHCSASVCIECGANTSLSQFLITKPLSRHESLWVMVSIPQTGPKISTDVAIHVLIFSKRGRWPNSEPMGLLVCCQWSSLTNQTSVLLYIHQSDDRVCVTCQDLSGSVWVWPALHKRPLPDSLYAALLVIRSSVKLSIAKTRDIGWGWNYKFPAFYLPRVAQPQTEFIQKSEKLCSLRKNPSLSRIMLRLKPSRLEEDIIYSI